jgi:hypothetical protein
MANLKSLQEVANTAPGSYVSGGFQAVVSKVKERTAKATGKKFYACSITEGNLTIAALCDRDVTALEGKLVKFMGLGIKRGNDYNGVAQVNIGDKTTILPVGDGVIAVPLTTSQQPVQYINSPAEAASVSRIEGVTVGMAINKAVDIWRRKRRDALVLVFHLNPHGPKAPSWKPRPCTRNKARATR